MSNLPLRNREDLMQAIERNRMTVSELGRLLARNYTFEYPEQLESTALKGWQEFTG